MRVTHLVVRERREPMQQKGWIREAGRYRALWVKFRRDVRAQDLIEYALMAGFIAVASAAVMPQMVSPSAS